MNLRALLLPAMLLATAAAAEQPSSSGHLVSVRELAAALNDRDLVVLHVAEREAPYLEGHIPGARFLRYGDIAVAGEDDLGAELPPASELERVFESVGVTDSTRVVIYGSPVLAARLFFTLDVAGHHRVALLDGGLSAWRADGRPVATGPDRPGTFRVRSGSGQTRIGPDPDFSVRINPERLATAEWIQKNAASIALVDVRPDPEFTGSDGGMGGMHAAGHIEGARQLTWGSLVRPDGRFLPADELRAKLAAAGAAPGKPVVSYCMVGMRASVVYFVARHLGFDARLYDGSIVDWGRRKLPTTTGR